MSCRNSTLAGAQSDLAREYIIPLLKSIGNFSFSSFYIDNKYQPASLLGHGEEIYDKSYYIHRFDFACVGLIQREDTIDINPGVPLREIEASINIPFTANLT